MTRRGWTWEQPESGAPDGVAPARAVRWMRARRLWGAIAAAVIAIVAMVLSTASFGGHRRDRHVPATTAIAAVHPGRRPARASSGNHAIDALLRRQAVVFEGGRRGHEVALTFDDGPGPYTPALVSELRRLRVRATFFAIGEMQRYFGASTRSQHRQGDEIGDHTETHPLMARLPLVRQQAEIVTQTQQMSRLGVPYPRLFRPPYGSYDRVTLAVLRAARMLLVLWSTDTEDYTRPGVSAIVRRALSGARPGAIILMHDGGGDRSQTVAALPMIIRGLRRRGLHPVPMTRLLRDDPPPPGLPIPNVARG